MSDFSNYYRDVIGDHLLKGGAFSPAANYYIAIFTAATGLADNNPSAEIAEAGYARVEITLDAFVDGVSTNSAAITFAAAEELWTEATHFAIVDHLSNVTWGSDVNVLMWDALTVAKTVTSGNALQFNAGEIDVTIQ